MGRCRILQGRELLPEPFIDIRDEVATSHLEQGLLGMAFHPDYASNRRFFLSYTDRLSSGDTFVVEHRADAADPNSTKPVDPLIRLRFDRPSVGHNGGTIRFGPNGLLYIGSGDGGAFGYVTDRVSQELDKPFGKILRIDVDAPSGEAYRIPASNPWAGSPPPKRGSAVIDVVPRAD